MAALFDAVGPSGGAGFTGAAVSSGTWAHICSGTNRALIVGIAVGVNPDGGITASATYAGVAMTAGPVVHSGTTAAGFVQLFSLAAPATGTNNVVVTLTGGTATLSAGSVSFTAASQSSPLGTPATNADANAANAAPTVTVPSSTSGNPIIDVLAQGSGTAVSSAGTGQTIRWQRATDGNTRAGGGASSTKTSTGGATTMSYTLAASDHWAIVAAEVLPYVAPAAGAPARPQLTRQAMARASLR